MTEGLIFLGILGIGYLYVARAVRRVGSKEISGADIMQYFAKLQEKEKTQKTS